MQTITSRRHPLVLACRDARAGGDDVPLLLDGWHLLTDAIGHVAVDTVAVGPDPLPDDASDVLARLDADGALIVRVTDDVLQAMSPVRTPTGVVALARRPVRAVADVFAPGPALVVLTVDVQDPGNLGTLIRTAEAAGATGLVAAGASADPLGWKALRASMGSAFRLPVVRVSDVAAACADARSRSVQLCALVPRNGAAPSEVDLTRPTCFVLGSEGQGLSAELLTTMDLRLTVPMRAPVESLNVAVAGALALYAAAEQRRGST